MDSSRNEGVRGQSHTAHGGVVGLNDWSATGSEPSPSDGVGVYGQAAAFGTSGIYGSNSSGTGVSGRGLIGVNAEGDGVAGVVCRGTDYGIWAFANSSGALAGNFEGNVSIKGSGSPFTFALGVGGNVYIEGTLSVTGPIQKFGGGFRIDHPTDPANQYLTHSFVESPDRKNVYDGVAVLDAKGEAAVKMPAWFDALNGDFRYQLTAIDPPGLISTLRAALQGTFSRSREASPR